MELQEGVEWQLTGSTQKIREDLLLRVILPVSALLAIVSLSLTSSYQTMFGIYLRGVVMGVIIGVPDWPYFFRNPSFWFVPLPLEDVQPCITTSRRLKKRSHSARRR